jgi:hypothetical protein
MKGKGIKVERETIINFNEDSDEATIWTASETIYRRLKKRGIELMEDNERSAIFKCSKTLIMLPRQKPPRILSPERKAALSLRMHKLAQKRREGPSALG